MVFARYGKATRAEVSHNVGLGAPEIQKGSPRSAIGGEVESLENQ
jgi:hypothetical protein